MEIYEEVNFTNMQTNDDMCFTNMLINKYLIPYFTHSFDTKYNGNFLDKNIEFNDKNALIASIIFETNGNIIPFQYKLTTEQIDIYNKNKDIIIDNIVWYIFDINICKYLVDSYGIFKIIKIVIDKYAIENMFHIFDDDDLYYYYTYYILLEYFENIVYNANNKDNIATNEDIYNLQMKINDITKMTKIKSD